MKTAVITIASRHTKKPNEEAENHGATDALPRMEAQHISGIKLIDIETDREWTNIVAEHVVTCGALFPFVKPQKKGFKRIDFYQCKHCHMTLCKHSCCSSQESAMEPPGKPGPKTAELNSLMAVAAYCSGVTPTRLEAMCANAGIVCRSKSN